MHQNFYFFSEISMRLIVVLVFLSGRKNSIFTPNTMSFKPILMVFSSFAIQQELHEIHMALIHQSMHILRQILECQIILANCWLNITLSRLFQAYIPKYSYIMFSIFPQILYENLTTFLLLAIFMFCIRSCIQ